MPNSEAKKLANRKYANSTRKQNFTHISLPKTTHQRLKQVAEQENCTMIQLIENLLDLKPSSS